MIKTGKEFIKSLLAEIPNSSGIYKMLDGTGNIIYIGKAKNLRKRLTSYTQNDLSNRIARMVFLVQNLEYLACNSEAEALILEAQLIKKHQPKFNILLKDDKSFPYIKLRLDHDFPQLIKYRGKELKDGKYFGPFATVSHVDTTLSELQKIFKLRSCTDNYFKNRKRPCLQYQIKRCSAPCVNKISLKDYMDVVTEVNDFLNGRTKALQTKLAQKMEEHSKAMEFEQAAALRDKIKALTNIQAKSGLGDTSISDADVIAIYDIKDEGEEVHNTQGQQYCVQVFMYRTGQTYGNKAYFPQHSDDSSKEDVLGAFLGQFYQTHVPPQEILLSYQIKEKNIISDALGKLYNIKKIQISQPKSGSKAKLVANAYLNAQLAFKQYRTNTTKNLSLLSEIQKLFNLPNTPERIEVYDNSHIMGRFATGAMVVVTPSGFDKKEYRLFNVKSTVDQDYNKGLLRGGDDFYMLRQVITRRLLRIKKEPQKTPDLMIIDGGKGHLSVVKDVMQEQQVFIPFVCMAKGPDRNAGLEQFYLPDKTTFTLDKNLSVMKYLQIIRDEVHNFAIKNHRNKRAKSITTSSLDDIQTIGKVRKKALLNHFGSYKAISEASIDEIAKVPNISRKIAENIFKYLHNGNVAR